MTIYREGGYWAPVLRRDTFQFTGNYPDELTWFFIMQAHKIAKPFEELSLITKHLNFLKRK